MRNKIIVFVALLSLSACSNSGTGNADTAGNNKAETSTPEDVKCYIHTDGLKNEDTTFLKLVIKDNEVSGSLSYMPYEKDRAIGFLNGKKDGAVISGTWRYTIEGSQDSVAVDFKMTPDGILQKQAVYNSKTNTIAIPDTAQYSIPYKMVDCSFVR